MICIGSVSGADNGDFIDDSDSLELDQSNYMGSNLADADSVTNLDISSNSLSDFSLDGSDSALDSSNPISNSYLDKSSNALKSTLKDSSDKSSNANLTVRPNQTSYKYGSNPKLFISLYDNQTPLNGTVLVTVDQKEHRVDISNGNAELIIEGLENNTYPVLAQFIGNDFYEPVINNDAVIVINKSRVVNGTASVTELVSYGENVLVTIENLADVDGKKISLYGGYQLVGPKTPYGAFYVKKGSATLSIPLLPVGNYSIYMVFGNNVGGNYALPVFVLNFSVVKEKAAFSVDVKNITEGEDAIIGISLKDSHGYGVEICDMNNTLPVVEFECGDIKENITLDMGEGSLNLTGLSMGVHDCSLRFASCDFYEEAYYSFSFNVRTQASISYKVRLDKTIRPDGEMSDDSIVFTLAGMDGPLAERTVFVLVDGMEYKETTDSKGQISLNYDFKNNKTYEFVFKYDGDEIYDSLSKTLNVSVNRKNSILEVSNKVFLSHKPTKSLTAVFKLNNGKAIVGKTIKFVINGKTYYAKTNSKGKATVKLSLSKKGTYGFIAEFLGDSKYAPIRKSAKLIIK